MEEPETAENGRLGGWRRREERWNNRSSTALSKYGDARLISVHSGARSEAQHLPNELCFPRRRARWPDSNRDRKWANSDYLRVAWTAHGPGLSVIPTIDPVASWSTWRRSSRGPAISNSSVATGVSRAGLPTDK
jgi:hypothetical protein